MAVEAGERALLVELAARCAPSLAMTREREMRGLRPTRDLGLGGIAPPMLCVAAAAPGGLINAAPIVANVGFGVAPAFGLPRPSNDVEKIFPGVCLGDCGALVICCNVDGERGICRMAD